MRLKTSEVQAIKRSFNSLLSGVQFDLYLFGSRADDKKKGGDIDLLVVCEDKDKARVYELKYKISAEIQKQIGEQRVDITVAARHECETDVFLKSIFSTAILL